MSGDDPEDAMAPPFFALRARPGVEGAGAVAAARALRQLLGVEPLDPPSFAAAAALLGVVALLAAWLPARRAAAVEPALVLPGDS